MEISCIQDITYKIVSKNSTIVFNPLEASAKDQLALYSSAQPNLGSSTSFFDSPGEYEVSEIMIEAVAAGTGGTSNIAYCLWLEDMRLCHLGQLEADFNPQKLESFGAVDILLLPINTLAATEIAKIISEIEPTIIIPMTWSDQELKHLSDEIGLTPQNLDKFRLTKKDLPDASQQLLALKPTGKVKKPAKPSS